jgi:hypothetical protein
MIGHRGRMGAFTALTIFIAAALTGPGLARAEPEECEVPAELTEIDVKLTRVAERLHAHQPVTIVAIGGASTIGAAAGQPDLAYPHRLQVALTRAFPDAAINVVNKGVPRQLTRQMLERFPTDVIAEDPVLVIWEAGITDAVRGAPIDDFTDSLQNGIDELKNRAIDTILVDMQFSRRTTTLIDFDKYLKALHRVGELNEVYVFPRFDMMRYWSEQNMFNFDEVSPDERAAVAGRVYDCIGRKLAQTIKLAVE